MGSWMQSCQSQRNIWKHSSHIKAFPDLPPLLSEGGKEAQRNLLPSSSAASSETVVGFAVRSIVSTTVTQRALVFFLQQSIGKVSLSVHMAWIPLPPNLSLALPQQDLPGRCSLTLYWAILGSMKTSPCVSDRAWLWRNGGRHLGNSAPFYLLCVQTMRPGLASWESMKLWCFFCYSLSSYLCWSCGLAKVNFLLVHSGPRTFNPAQE